MAKVTVNHMFSSVSGKLCRKETTCISYNKQTGKMYSTERHGCTQPNTELQMQARSTFTTKAKLAASWWKANKPSAANADGTEAYQKVKAAFKTQIKIGNPYSYLRSLVTDDLKVMLGDTDITDGVTASGGSSSSAPSGGGSSSGGAEVEG